MDQFTKEVKEVKEKIHQDDTGEIKEQYFKITENYKSLNEHRSALMLAQQSKRDFDFQKIDKKTKYIDKENCFLNNYLSKGSNTTYNISN